MPREPETCYLHPTPFCPNNTFPVLIYRDALPQPHSEEHTTAFLEQHAWLKGGTWGHIDVRHFHPNTHECYGVFAGSSTLLIGCGKNDVRDENIGQEIKVTAGDVIVLPAGTGHCNTESSEDYKYVGLYPKDAPKWRFELGTETGDGTKFNDELSQVEMPVADPVFGRDGPLMRIWL